MSTVTEWPVLERLLLAQAVHKHGEDNWSQVARTLKLHPLLQDHAQPELFNQKNCSLQFHLMIETMDSESAQSNNADAAAQDMPKVEKLARQLYFQRVEELRRIISEDEERFVTLLAEIEDIKTGTATTTANDQQASPTKVDSDIKPVVENGTIEQDGTKVPTDEPSTQHDIKMEETEKAPTNQENDTDSYQQTGTPMDLSPTQNETTIDHAVNDNEEATEKHKDLPATDELDDGSTTTAQPPLDNTSVAKLEQSDHRDGDKDMDSDLLMGSPVVNETSAPSSPPTAAADDTLVSEPSVTELGTKRLPSDSTSPNADLDQHVTLESSPKRQRLDHPDIPRSPSFSTPAQSVDDHMESNSIDEGITPEQASISKTPNTTEASEADQAESDHIEANKPSPNTATPVQSPPPSVTTATAEISAEEPSTALKTESPATNVVATESSTNTPGLPTETVGVEDEEDNLSLSMKDADGTDSVAGTDSNAATPSATATASEKRRSFSSGNIKDDPRQKSWQKNVNHLWREIANHKNGAMFMNPIKEAQAPLYYQVVKYPMDLKTIKNRIRDGVIRTTVEFERDVVLMLTNSLMYNKEGTEIYQMAHEMLQDVTEQIKIFKTADGNSSSHIKGASILAKDRQRSVAE